MGKKFFSFLFLLLAFPAYATTYHVSSTGNNRHDGESLSQAWRTVKFAARQVSAGDVVLIHAGNYQREHVKVEVSGTKAAPIRFQADPNEKAVVGSFIIRNAHWIEIIGLTVKGPKVFPATWRDMPEVVIDDPAVGFIDPREPWPRRKLKVERKFKTYMALKRHMENGYRSGIMIQRGSSHITVKNTHISNFTSGILMTDNSSFVLLENNTIHHCRNAIWTFAKKGVVATDVVIRGNSCAQNLISGIDIRDSARRVIIEKNVCEYNGISHIGFRRSSTDGVIRSNRVQYGGYYAETMQAPGSSALNLYALGPHANVLVEGNYSAYQREPTWDSNGIIVDRSSHTGTIIRHNVFYRNMGAGINVTKSPLVYIYNNTAVENGYQATGVLSPLNGPGLRIPHKESKNLRIVNNIFYKNRIAGYYSGGYLRDQTRVNYNLYFQASGAAALRDGHSKKKIYRTVKDIPANITVEHQGIEGDPQFLNSANGNFRIKPESVAVDAGGFHTRTVGAGSGRHIHVEDAGYFFPGFGDHPGDQVMVGSQSPRRISAIDKVNNIITVETPLIWADQTAVSLPYVGKAPEIGAFEFSAKASEMVPNRPPPVLH